MAIQNLLLIMKGGTMPFMYGRQNRSYVHPDSFYRPASECRNFRDKKNKISIMETISLFFMQ